MKCEQYHGVIFQNSELHVRNRTRYRINLTHDKIQQVKHQNPIRKKRSELDSGGTCL